MRGSLCLLSFFLVNLSSVVVSAEELRDTVLVTASRVSLPLLAVGSSVSVIDRDEIEARQAPFAVNLFSSLPGFSISRSGSIGAQTQVRVRGAEANQLLVLIDGVEANDPAGNDEFPFQDLTTWDIERIEIVRGPQSALWGSDALAGVVNVITREPSGEFGAGGFAEVGSFDTYSAGGRIQGSVSGARTSLSLSTINSHGSNNSRLGNEADGYKNTTGTLRLGGSPSEALALDFTGRFTRSVREFDGTDFVGTGLPFDTGDEAETSQGYFRAGAALSLADGRWTQRLRGTWTTTDTENRNEFGDNGATAADKYGMSYQTTWRFSKPTPESSGDAITLAIEQERQEFRQRGVATPFGDPNQKQALDNTGVVLELLLSPLPRTSVSLSGRYDDNSDIEDVATFRATAAHTIGRSQTRLHASLGTGQKTPTFIERFGFFADQFIGNPDLKPESSIGWEAGIEQSLFGARLTLAATYFRETLEDEINGFAFDPNSSSFTAENLQGRSKRRGVELSATSAISNNLRLTGSYTYTDATEPNAVTGVDTREIRRPRHSASVNGTWQGSEGTWAKRFDLNLNVAYVGQQNDTFFEVAPPFGTESIALSSYYLVSAAAGFRLAENAQLYLRVENTLDDDYEDVYGYNTPGRSVAAGLRVTF